VSFGSGVEVCNPEFENTTHMHLVHEIEALEFGTTYTFGWTLFKHSNFLLILQLISLSQNWNGQSSIPISSNYARNAGQWPRHHMWSQSHTIKTYKEGAKSKECNKKNTVVCCQQTLHTTNKYCAPPTAHQRKFKEKPKSQILAQ
jgi:hypothetical protein